MRRAIPQSLRRDNLVFVQSVWSEYDLHTHANELNQAPSIWGRPILALSLADDLLVLFDPQALPHVGSCMDIIDGGIVSLPLPIVVSIGKLGGCGITVEGCIGCNCVPWLVCPAAICAIAFSVPS